MSGKIFGSTPTYNGLPLTGGGGSSGGIAGHTASTTTIATGAGPTATSAVDVSEASSVAFHIINVSDSATYSAGLVLIFEQSNDAVEWAPLYVTRSDTIFSASQHTLLAGTVNRSVKFEAPVLGIAYVRARTYSTLAGSSSVSIVIQPSGSALTPAQAVSTPTRSPLFLTRIGVSAGGTGTEALGSMTKTVDTTVYSAASTLPIAAGKRWCFTSITLGQQGHVTATTASTLLRLRYNSAGAVTTSSTILWEMRVATPQTSAAYQSITIPFPDGTYEIVGGDTVNIGFSLVTSYTTNAPTTDVFIAGYEYSDR